MWAYNIVSFFEYYHPSTIGRIYLLKTHDLLSKFVAPRTGTAKNVSGTCTGYYISMWTEPPEHDIEERSSVVMSLKDSSPGYTLKKWYLPCIQHRQLHTASGLYYAVWTPLQGDGILIIVFGELTQPGQIRGRQGLDRRWGLRCFVNLLL